MNPPGRNVRGKIKTKVIKRLLKPTAEGERGRWGGRARENITGTLALDTRQQLRQGSDNDLVRAGMALGLRWHAGGIIYRGRFRGSTLTTKITDSSDKTNVEQFLRPVVDTKNTG